MVSYERVTPLRDAVAVATRILQEAWRPPALFYTEASLAWEFTYPGTPPGFGVLACDGEEPVGFAAVVPRRLRFKSETVSGYVLSFVAVRPNWRGRGIAPLLYATLLDAVDPGETPILTFAHAGSPGHTVLERSYAAARHHVEPLAPCSIWGIVVRGAAADGDDDTDDAVAIRAVVDACTDGNTIWGAPGLEQLRHHATAPGERGLVAVGDGGAPAAAALLMRSRVATARGAEGATTITALYMPEPSVALLNALVRAAARRWDDGRGVVTVANVSTLDPSLLHACGLRRTGTRFACYLSAPRGHVLLAAARTNLEVV